MLDKSRRDGGLTDDDYLRMSAAAKEIGRGEWFSNYNKLLSKHVHATAYSVLSFPTERGRTLTSNLMLHEGTQSCLRVLGRLNTYFKQNNLPALY